MNVVVLNTGSELLLGHVLNSHLTFIAREIFPLGLRVERQITVPDGPAIGETLAAAALNADIIIVTGGLGPTTDDITREAAAALFKLPLIPDAAVAAGITERLRSRGFPLTNRVLRQAEVPKGATVLPNTNGTAPGLYLTGKNGLDRPLHLFLLPGPPRELQPMFQNLVMPTLQTIAPRTREMLCRTFRLAGVGESVVEAAVGEQLLALPEGEIGYCARLGEVDVRVIGPQSTLDSAEALIQAAFPHEVFSQDNEELETVVVRLLRERDATLAIAESCTGGYLAHRVTNVPGASSVFGAGFVTYANEMKTETLDVPEILLAEFGAVSVEVVAAMASGAMAKARSTYALATTGIAGPDGGSEAKPVGTVYIALASATGTPQVLHRRFQAERQAFKLLVTQAAMQMLRARLLAEERAVLPTA